SSVQPFVPSLKSSRVRMRGNGLYLDRRTSEARIALRIAEVSAAVSTEVTFEHSFLPAGASVLIIGGSRAADISANVDASARRSSVAVRLCTRWVRSFALVLYLQVRRIVGQCLDRYAPRCQTA